ncbi:putative Dipeptidase 1 [Glarea lozoyensis 74030]|uniref:Dipeptidase n=1 Tax=Glarea lozoyensis (strain ATCC 74030 / MF5533) TaxID=1104152 RepID=H0EUT7_GLAL7|nr:putative Dipeptidase 1 [Glarea lozoyensis 74030]
MYSSVIGLEDASKYPNLIVELLRRGWNDTEINNVMGENLMRVMDEVDKVKEDMKDKIPSTAIWEKRTDLPADWGGPDLVYLPYDVQDVVNSRPKHDELSVVQFSPQHPDTRFTELRPPSHSLGSASNGVKEGISYLKTWRKSTISNLKSHRAGARATNKRAQNVKVPSRQTGVT